MRYIPDDDFAHLCAELGVSEKKQAPLRRALNTIAERLAPWEGTVSPKNRCDQLDQVIDHFTAAATLMRSADPMMAIYYRRAWSEPLCTLLGPDAPGALYGDGLDIRIDDHRLSSREFNRVGGASVSSLIKPEMANFIDLRSAHGVLEKVLAELAASLAGIDVAPRDGRPPKALRDEAIVALANVFGEIIERVPTSGKTGEFLRFCEMAFDGIGLPTTGLETAVGRVLRRCRQNYPEKV